MPTASLPRTDEFLATLGAAQRAKFRGLVRLLGRPARSLSTYYAIAGAVAALRPAGAGYGAAWVKALCAALGRAGAPLSLSLAYRLLRFHTLFKDVEGTDLVRQLDGKVSWESMMRVLHIKDADVREAVLRRAAAEGLSSRQVLALVREATGYRRGRGGRPAAPAPTHPNRALKDLKGLASRWAAVSHAWTGTGNNAFKRAGRLKPEQVTDAFLADLEAVVRLTGTTAQIAGGLAEDLSKLLATLRARGAGPRRR